MFDGAVKWVCADYIKPMRLRLVCFCETKQFFVFEGPEMLPPNAADTNEDPTDATKN